MPLSLKREMSCKGCNEKVSAVSELPMKWCLFIDMYTNALMAIQKTSLGRIIVLQVLLLSFIHLYLYC